MATNVKRTARLQWKVDTIKNCKYLQCVHILWGQVCKVMSRRKSCLVCNMSASETTQKTCFFNQVHLKHLLFTNNPKNLIFLSQTRVYTRDFIAHNTQV